MSTSKSYDLKKDLTLLAQGSESAFARLFDRYNGRILNVGFRFLKSRVLAEEVVQEVFLKVWLRRSTIANVDNFDAYIFSMARNVVFDGLKRIAKETIAGNEFTQRLHPVAEADNLILEEQYDQLLWEAVDRLPSQQKQIFKLARVEGLSHQAIAEQLDISRLTVKSHMAKALRSIRRNLDRHLATITMLPVISQNFFF